MSGQVRELVAELCANTSDYLFIDEGSPVSRSHADVTFRKACRKAEIYDLNFHALRQTFRTRLGEHDVNLKKIARLMGHTTTKHTEIYVHATDSGLTSAMEIATLPSTDRTAAVKTRVAESA